MIFFACFWSVVAVGAFMLSFSRNSGGCFLAGLMFCVFSLICLDNADKNKIAPIPAYEANVSKYTLNSNLGIGGRIFFKETNVESK